VRSSPSTRVDQRRPRDRRPPQPSAARPDAARRREHRRARAGIRSAGTLPRSRRAGSTTSPMWLLERFGGRWSGCAASRWLRCRRELLDVPGLGPETVDAILLYAAAGRCSSRRVRPARPGSPSFIGRGPATRRRAHSSRLTCRPIPRSSRIAPRCSSRRQSHCRHGAALPRPARARRSSGRRPGPRSAFGRAPAATRSSPARRREEHVDECARRHRGRPRHGVLAHFLQGRPVGQQLTHTFRRGGPASARSVGARRSTSALATLAWPSARPAGAAGECRAPAPRGGSIR